MALLAHQLISYVLPGQPYGRGSLGDYSSGTIPTFIRLSCSGTSGSTTLTVSTTTFTNGDLIKIIQTRGTGVGQWEIALVASGGGSTSLTLSKNLVYTYTDSGSSQAQAIKINEYTNATLGTGTWTVPTWDQNVGGSFIIAARTFTGVGTLSAASAGFRGGDALDGAPGYRGEGNTADKNTASVTGNNNAGGGGENGGGGSGASGNGSGGNGAVNDGGASASTDPTAGSNSNANTINLGGGGGGSTAGDPNARRAGGLGGGSIAIFASTISLSGQITVAGAQGGVPASGNRGGGSGGAGHILIVGQTVAIGTDLLRAVGGAAAASQNKAGAKGLITVYYGSQLTGSTSSSYYGAALTEQDQRLKLPIRRGMLI